MALNNFIVNDDGTLPTFIESVDDFPHLLIVTLHGAIDRNVLPEAESFLKRMRKKNLAPDKSVILDLRKVTNVDTSAIAVILRLLADLKKKKFRLGLVSVPKKLLGQLEILKLDSIVTVFESRTAAFHQIQAWSEEWA